MIPGRTKVTNVSADLENDTINVEDKHNKSQNGEDRVMENKKTNNASKVKMKITIRRYMN